MKDDEIKIAKNKDLSKDVFNKFIKSQGLEERAVDYLFDKNYEYTLDNNLDYLNENKDLIDNYGYLYSEDYLDEGEYIEETLYENIEKRIKYLKTMDYKDYIKYGYIDEKYFDEIEEFLKFYIVALLMKKNLGKFNLKDMCKDIFDTDRFDESITEEDLETMDEWIDEDSNFKKFYNKICRDLSNSTQDKEILKLANVKKSNKENYRGRIISKKSELELKSMVNMWEHEDKLSSEANKAHKKIKSDTLEKMTDKNYKMIHDHLNNEIINSDKEYKNIYFYSLEFKLANELRKCTLENLNKIKGKYKKLQFISDSILYIYSIPVLTIREDLSNKLLSSLVGNDVECIERFREEVSIIRKIIAVEGARLLNLIEEYPSYKNFTNNDLSEFEKIYNIDNGNKSFENKYKIKIDYSKDDVIVYNKIIKIINTETKNNIVKKIKDNKENKEKI
ncbi:hypothetical protein [Paraclostridium bifermentans]|uniref:hypothetical protein n=1 Tax=Paraclostridium bifermentans TaxID=1490 RepID=UPI001898662C|nr:hypothetical protein [Paraclostridium bifermentans]